MNKRVLSLLLVVAMLASLVVFPVNAAEGDPYYCPHCQKDIPAEDWKAWSPDMARTGGHYRLEEDLVTDQMNFGTSKDTNNYCLDLNGHIWRAAKTRDEDGEAVNQHLMTVGTDPKNPGVVFSVFDNSAAKTGEMQAYGTNNGTAVIAVTAGTTFNLYSGTIRQLYAADVTTAFGALYVFKSNFNMYGGKITDGYNASAGEIKADGSVNSGTYGANLTIRGASAVTMSGGEITNGRSLYNAAGVNVIAGTFTMTGGKIYNNAADGNGGNIQIGASGTAILKNNAVVKNGVAGGKGANIYNNGTLRLENISVNGFTGAAPADADVKVDGDIYTANSKTANITLAGEVDITAGNSNGILIAEGKLLKFADDVPFDATNSLIYVGIDWKDATAVGTNKSFTEAKDGVDAYATSFRPVGTSYAKSGDTYLQTAGSVAGSGTTTALALRKSTNRDKSYCPHCNGFVTWKDATLTAEVSHDTGNMGNGHYFLSANHTIPNNGKWTLTGTSAIAINTNGYRLTANNHVVQFNANNQQINFVDTRGNGVAESIILNTDTACRGGVVNAYKNAAGTNVTGQNVRVYSGTLMMSNSADVTSKVKAGGIIGVNAGTITIYGGILKNGNAEFGSNLWAHSNAATINVYAGLITGGRASANGANIYANTNTTLNIHGGIIENGTATQFAGNIDLNTTKAVTIKNALIRGGVNTGTSSNVYAGNIGIRNTGAVTLENVTIANGTAADEGGNIGINAAANVTMTNVAVINGDAVGYGGNIYVGKAATINATKLMSLGGTVTEGNGGGLSVNAAANVTLTNAHFADGSVSYTGDGKNIGNGGNIYASAAAKLEMENCCVYNGSASGSVEASTGNGGNIYVQTSNAINLNGCVVDGGTADVNGGNIFIRNNNDCTAYLTDCVVSNGVSGDPEIDNAGLSDNIFCGVSIVLDNVKTVTRTDANAMGGGLNVVNNRDAAPISVTLKGHTEIGNADDPLNGSLLISKSKTESVCSLIIDSSFTGMAVLAPTNFFGYTEDGISNLVSTDPYGMIMENASYITGDGGKVATGELYLGNHKTEPVFDEVNPEVVTKPSETWEYEMPKIFPVDDGKLQVASGLLESKTAKEYYLTAQDAVDAYTAGKVVKVLAVADTLTLAGGEYYIDVNGKMPTVSATAAATVYGLDSANAADLKNMDGALTVGENVTIAKAATSPIDGEQYVNVQVDDLASFHNIKMDITKVNLRTGTYKDAEDPSNDGNPENGGIYYKGVWTCDEDLTQYINDNKLNFGIVVSDEKMPDKNFATENTKDNVVNLYSVFQGGYDSEFEPIFQSGEENTSTLIKNIMKTDLDPDKNAARCATKIHAIPYLQLGEGEYIVGEEGVSLSMMDVLKKIDVALGESKLANNNAETLLKAFYEFWKDHGLSSAIETYENANSYTFSKVFKPETVAE